MKEQTPVQVYKKAKKEAKKECKQALKNGTEKFYPVQLSLTQWCTVYGNLDRLDWITELIFSELEQDKELEEYIYFRFEPCDIRLDSDGVLILWDTLSGFFGHNQVKGMYKYLKAHNKEKKFFYEIEMAIKGSTENELERYFRVWEEARQNKTSGQDIITRVLDMIQKEKKRRSEKTGKIKNYIKGIIKI